MHDCLPPRSEIAVPNYIQGEWCGVSYQAYVDFISQRHDLAVYTVDTDYGCGVIRKLVDPSPESATAAGAELLLQGSYADHEEFVQVRIDDG